jgi:hypothetical protein
MSAIRTIEGLGLQLRKAGHADAAALTDLINRAFRVERSYALNERITVGEVEAHLAKGEFHVLEDEGGWPDVSTWNCAASGRTWVCFRSTRRGRRAAWDRGC